ncbi:MAG TPA: DUF5996 family protein [Cytophagales bacterium]|nr:DUF5996 family protein [Cytophagales bacterium]
MKSNWPKLSYSVAKETYETLHLFTQIAGKVKLKKMPWINHSWHVTLLISPKGLTTSYISDNDKIFQIEFNFIEHQMEVMCDNGQNRSFKLTGLSVADFYFKLMEALKELHLHVKINTVPNELIDPIPFEKDYTHSTYEPKYVEAFHKALINVQNVLMDFRAGFKGKCSPIHFFWGSFDLAFSMFSGREAPKHPGGIPNLPDWVAQEAYSNEVYSCGFWPGSEILPEAAFYSYIYPEPEGFMNRKVSPEEAYYHKDLREFILPYEFVRQSSDPAKSLRSFLHSTYKGAVELAEWDRISLEKQSLSND